MRIVNLFSGSSGNSTYVGCGDGALLFDAGGSAKSILCSVERIGEDPRRIGAVFITHDHTDHVSALRTLLKKLRIPVYIPNGCVDRIAPHISDAGDLIVPIKDGDEVPIFGCSVISFRVPHDSAACFGYRVNGNDRTLGIMTDAGQITDRVTEGLTGCTDALLEANHDVGMVLSSALYPKSLKDRILSGGGHLSNEACAGLISALAPHGLKRVMLSHLSRENNTPETAEKAVMLELARNGISGVTVCSASADTETELF
ncbi:MAG: MBL fold metallo-hydrolase [Clostridia bacterium]|nr:MBL fold metallo-hydrolase [Clostridia bacterium]